MAKKQYFLVVDTETTITDKVADFGAVIVDRNGKIAAQCGVMVQGVFGVDSLFFDKNNDGIWARTSVERRTNAYSDMLNAGTRMLASTAAINRWLEKAVGKFDPELTAYNLPFDVSKCANTGIDLTMFSRRFCLWAAAVGNICNKKPYRQFVLDNHRFNQPTDKGNMTFKTDAETVTGFLSGQMTEEPHTSIEDIIGYEVPTLAHILKIKGWREKMIAYNWRSHQVKDHFKA